MALGVLLAAWNGYLLVYAYGARGLVPALPIGVLIVIGTLALRGLLRQSRARRFSRSGSAPTDVR